MHMYECIATRLGPVGGLFETVGCGEPSGYQLLCGTSTCSMMSHQRRWCCIHCLMASK